jgi:uroporphyrinogen-III synthase
MRVLVTRPQADAERTARALAARWHEAVLAPVLAIARTAAPPPPGAFEAIITTSANAIPALASLDARAKGLPIFAVGERTASAAAEAGFHDVRTGHGDALSLAGMITRALPPGAKLLHIASRERKPEPEAALSSAGFAVATWVAYEAVAAERLPEAGLRALDDGRLEAALHYSRRSVGVIWGLVEDAGLRAPFCALAHLCLSADAATPLRAAGARRVIVAPRPDETSLLAALDEYAEKCGQAGSPAEPSG